MRLYATSIAHNTNVILANCIFFGSNKIKNVTKPKAFAECEEINPYWPPGPASLK